MAKLNDILQGAQKVRAMLSRVQEDLSQKRVVGSSGGGMVRVTADGQQNILKIEIDPEVVSPQDVGMLEDLILAAVNEAKRKSQEVAAEEMKKITGGLLPPGFQEFGALL